MSQQEHLDSQVFLRMVREGYTALSQHKEEINALNVFPVPDGDTGTNMTLSFAAGLAQVELLPADAPLSRMAVALGSGLLMGARGNSGVILSQLCRGFQMAFATADVADARLAAKALTLGVQTAYKAVSRPVEGTILTVAKEAALAGEKAAAARGATPTSAFLAALSKARDALMHTPEQLPILRQAGVVDSGGQGFVFLLEGFCDALTERDGGSVRFANSSLPATGDVQTAGVGPGLVRAALAVEHGAGEFGYCTEMLIHVSHASDSCAEAVRRAMDPFGDSLLVVASGDSDQAGVIKVHVHTEHPGRALEAGLVFGALSGIKIDNMSLQHEALRDRSPDQRLVQEGAAVPAPVHTPSPASPCALIAIVSGDGLADIFRGLAVDQLIDSPDGVNPSTEEIMRAVERTDAATVFVLPNHPNVIMAAEQAATLSGGRVRVIRTKSVAQGLSAALAFVKTTDASGNEMAMNQAIAQVHSGAVTVAVRDALVLGQSVVAGDCLGVIDGEVRFIEPSLSAALLACLTDLCERSKEICTVFCARREDEALALHAVAQLQERFASLQFEVQYGGQPVYDYLLAGE